MHGTSHGGGGARGAHTAGVIHELALEGFWNDCGGVVDFAGGTSQGGLTAADIVQHDGDMLAASEHLVGVWEGLDGTNSVWRLRFPLGIPGLWNPSVGKATAVRKLIAATLDAEKVRKSPCKLYMPAVDLLTGELVVFNNGTPTHLGAYATAALPGLFEPAEWENYVLLDGGLRDVNPLGAAIKAGCTNILVTTCTKPGEVPVLAKKQLGNSIGVLKRCVEIMVSEIVHDDIKRCEQVNQEVKEGRSSKKLVDLVAVAPSEDLGDQLDFSKDLIAHRLALGRQDAQNALREYHRRST